jgi:UDP:flavonoid glycosyltransferase YjiC (YdhE family)
MRAAAQEVLAAPSFRAAAQQRAAMLASVDGAANAADEVEALLTSRSAARSAGDQMQCQQVA